MIIFKVLELLLKHFLLTLLLFKKELYKNIQIAQCHRFSYGDRLAHPYMERDKLDTPALLLLHKIPVNGIIKLTVFRP